MATKSTTVSTFQQAMQAEREADEQISPNIHGIGPDTDGGADPDYDPEADTISAPTPLAQLAERMARRSNPVGDPFEGMSLDVDPADAIGFVEGQVRAWVEEHGRWATASEIAHKAERLFDEARNLRPGPVGANGTYTVDPSGAVGSFEADAPPRLVEQLDLSPEIHGGLRVPSDSVFGDDGEFVISQPLTKRAQLLIERHPEHFEHLEGHKISVLYLWKKTGGKAKGRATFGKCSKPSGLLKHFSESTFVIWLAADHCRAAGYRDRELEALLFHEMLHTAVADIDENTGRGGGPTLVPHELEVFRAEVEIYGLWAPELKEVGPAFHQASLFDARVSQPSSDIDPADLGDAEDDRDAEDDAAHAQDALVCSVCGKLVDEDEMSLEEVSEARQNPAVVLCEACGEDGVQDDGDDSALDV